MSSKVELTTDVLAGSADKSASWTIGYPPAVWVGGAVSRCLRSAWGRLGRYGRSAGDRAARLAMRARLAAAPAVNVYRIDPGNVGDLKCGPRPYFGFLGRFLELDILAYQGLGAGLDGKAVIVGGGGMLGNDFCVRGLERLASSRGSTLICWGAGHNAHGSGRIERVGLLERFDLVGIRDYGHGHEWVPCVSCMDPAFDRAYRVEHEVVIYDHHAFPLRDAGAGVPRLSNACTDFGRVVAFLGSAESVVTTTYHGAYWATLLGRRVVVADPFSSKFHGFRHPPAIGGAGEWRGALRRARSYPESLGECRGANESFAPRVAELLGRRT